jgi:hypothetical protein
LSFTEVENIATATNFNIKHVRTLVLAVFHSSIGYLCGYTKWSSETVNHDRAPDWRYVFGTP